MKSRKEPPRDLLEWMAIRTAPEWSVAWPIGALFSVVLALLFVLALLAAGVLLVSTIFGGDRSLGAGALIVALLSSPFLIWGTYLKHRTVEFQKEGHLTDRLTKAVEQLGAEKTVKRIVTGEDGKPTTQEMTEPNLEVRMGGLLSLERIAQDSTAYDKGRDHVRVMEIICAYIRNNAPASLARKFPLGEWQDLPAGATDKEREDYLNYRVARFGKKEGDRFIRGSLHHWASKLPAPRGDIMLALMILGRRSDEQRQIEAAHEEWVHGIWGQSRYRLDLRNTCLQRADLAFLRFDGTRFDNARLEGADLSRSSLEQADLSLVRLDGAKLPRVNLAGAFLRRTNLDGVRLLFVKLTGAALRNLDLTNVEISPDQLNSCFGDGTATLPEGLARPEHWPVEGLALRPFFDEWRRWHDDPASHQSPPPKDDPP